ncbi:DNA/RNA non-specific endonuclease [Flavobacterium sp.]|uniref:DNA/RNA non-specific endonuclease n=1 Tax=Flavobacterium sp. TaxID=239 RepID=UPI0035B18E68
MKKCLFILVFSVFCSVLFTFCKQGNEDNTPKILKISNDIGLNENGFFDFLPRKTQNQIVKHDYYTLSYNEKFEQADWVAYVLKDEYIKYNSFKRPFFINDKMVTTHSADWKNYKNSGFDKGHLCPAGDMKFSKKAYFDTFLTSNISPQKHDFNDGVWNRLEEKVRYWAKKYDKLYVVSGGILNDNLSTIGYEKVAVPNYFYKIIARGNSNDMKIIAFLIPHEESNKPLYKFVVSVDQIEKLSNQDFFPKLQDDLENKIEKSSDYKDWSFN